MLEAEDGSLVTNNCFILDATAYLVTLGDFLTVWLLVPQLLEVARLYAVSYDPKLGLLLANGIWFLRVVVVGGKTRRVGTWVGRPWFVVKFEFL